MGSLLRALARYGGILVQPRATARALPDDEGLYDGIWLGVLYLLSVGLLDVLRGVATARVTANLSGLLMLLAAVGRVVVVPIVVLVACETVLGRSRAHRRGLLLVPLLVVVTAAHELSFHGLALRAFVPEIIGGLLCVALALWVRDEVPPVREESA